MFRISHRPLECWFRCICTRAPQCHYAFVFTVTNDGRHCGTWPIEGKRKKTGEQYVRKLWVKFKMTQTTNCSGKRTNLGWTKVYYKCTKYIKLALTYEKNECGEWLTGYTVTHFNLTLFVFIGTDFHSEVGSHQHVFNSMIGLTPHA